MRPAPIPRIRRPRTPSAAWFDAECVRAGRPVVIEGLATDWPARGWEFPDVARHLPERPLRAISVTGDDRREFRLVELTNVELTERLLGHAPPGDATTTDWCFEMPAALPELREEVVRPSVCPANARYSVLLGRDTMTHGHYHSHEHALICQIHGRKRVRMFSPHDTPHLFPFPLSDSMHEYSRVHFLEPDLARFPEVARAQPFETLLEPGDALFVPLHHWHAVFGLGPVMSVSALWPAKARDYRFSLNAARALGATARTLGATIGARVRKRFR